MTMTPAISRFLVPALGTLPEDVRAKILTVQTEAGFARNVFLTLAHRPDEFRAFFGYHDPLLPKSGATKGEKEMVIVAPCGANGSLCCVVAYGAILRICEKGQIIFDQLAVDYLEADMTPRQNGMLGFALKVSNVSYVIHDDDFGTLRKHGWTDERARGDRRHHRAVDLSNRTANLRLMRSNYEFYLLGRVSRQMR